MESGNKINGRVFVELDGKYITYQEIFDNAALGIVGQGGKSCYDERLDALLVMDDRGNRDAVGWSVTDAKPGDVTTPQWEALSLLPLGLALHDAHDETLHLFGFEFWQRYMSGIALDFGLDDSCVYFQVTKQK